MAGLAAGAELAFVHVVLGVASIAICWRLQRCLSCVRMAGFALQSGMVAGQAEISLGIMVKNPEGPTIWIVTCFTFCSKPFPVRVVSQVTGDAGRISSGKCRINMAFLTGGQRVLTDQGKSGDIVVKPDIQQPVFWLVAVCTLGTQFPIMCIILAVAVFAGGP